MQIKYQKFVNHDRNEIIRKIKNRKIYLGFIDSFKSHVFENFKPDL